MAWLFTKRSCSAAFITVVLFVPVQGEGNSRVLIEKEYQKASQATQVRFYDGCISSRHPKFQAFTPEGAPVHLGAERQRVQHIFRSAVSVSDRVALLSFRQISADKVECEVKNQFDFVLVGQGLKDSHLIAIETRNRDTWAKTPLGWKLLTTHVLKQAQSKKSLAAPTPEATKENAK